MVTQYIQRFTKRLSSLSPTAAIAGVLIVIVGVSGLAVLLTRSGSEANANPALQPYAARLDKVDGSVGISRTEAGDNQEDWAEATVNTPVTVGDRIYTRDYAHASIGLTGQNYVRLNPATSLDVLALEDHRTQFALRSGSGVFDVGALPTGDLYEVATPCGAIDFKEPGLYQIGMDGDNAIISVLNGSAQVVGMEGSGLISKGQVFTLTGATATEALASTLAPETAGEIVDDYYRYRYPKVYNGRYRSYDAYLADPSYYDPYRTSVSYQYLAADIPGLYDLDYYGDWVDVGNYGHCWAPRVNAGWAPYRSGYWDLDGLWGPSWISSEPWGWAPYHYGRWAFVNQRWFWVPAEVRTRAVYSPAAVAFIPFADQIAWVPLGPGEVYVARYYDNFRPYYLASPEVVRVVTVQNTFVNFNAPGAVTVVPVRAFSGVIDPRVISPVDLAVIGRSRAVIDPFSVTEVRQLATLREDGRRRIKIDRHEQLALNTAVVVSSTPEVLPVRGDLAKRFRVDAVSEKQRGNKLKVTDTAQVTRWRRADGLPQPLVQSQRMSELATRAEQGDKSAKREMRQLMQEQRSGRPLGDQSAQPSGATQQQAQQEQSRQQMKQQRKLERQQTAGAASQQAAQQAQQQQQLKQQRKAERQQQGAGAASQQAAQQAQQQQLKQQRKAERQAAAAAQQQQMQRQQQQQQQKRQQPPAKRKPPEAILQQQQQQRIQRAQQGIARQAQVQQEQRQAQASQRQVMKQQQAAQRQAVMQQQQAARAQASQRQAVMQQQQAAQAAQRQALKQQQQAAQASQRQALKQQQPAAQRQAASPSMQRAPAFVGPPARQNAPAKAEKAQRKRPQ
jgi:hypothetical protein